MSGSHAEMVREFHREVARDIDEKRDLDDAEFALLRARLILEEAKETVEALSLRDRAELADALADLLYVVYGTAVMYDLPIEAVFEEVHRANMEKEPGKDEGGKVTKPEDFEPPDVEGVLARHGGPDE